MLFKNLMTVFGIVAFASALSFAGPTETEVREGKGSKVEEKDGKVKGAVEKDKADRDAVENAGGGKATDFGAAKGADKAPKADVKIEKSKGAKFSDLKQVSDQALDNQAKGEEAKGAKSYTYEQVKQKGFVLKQMDELFGTVVPDRLAQITKEATDAGLSQADANRIFSQYYEFTLAGTEVLRRADSASGRWAEAVVAKHKADPKAVKEADLSKAQKQLKELAKADATEVEVAKKMDSDFVKKMLVNGSKVVKFEYTEGGKKVSVIDTLAGEGAGRACMGMSLEAVFRYGEILDRMHGESDVNKMIEIGSRYFNDVYKQGDKESDLRMCALASSGCKLFGRGLGKACELKMAALPN